MESPHSHELPLPSADGKRSRGAMAKVMSRRAALFAMLGAGGYAGYRILTPGSPTAADTEGAVTFEDLPDGADLVEQTLAIDRAGQERVRARILRIGTELKFLIARTVYKITNHAFDKPATTLVTAVRYNKPEDRIVIHADKRIPPFNTSGDASIPRSAYEHIILKLDAQKPGNTRENIEVEVNLRPLFRGTQVVSLELQLDTGDGIRLAAL